MYEVYIPPPKHSYVHTQKKPKNKKPIIPGMTVAEQEVTSKRERNKFRMTIFQLESGRLISV